MPFYLEIPHTFQRNRLLPILLEWAVSFDTCCLLNSNGFTQGWEADILACGVRQDISAETDSLEALQNFHKQQSSRAFGFLSYELSREIERPVNRETRVPSGRGSETLSNREIETSRETGVFSGRGSETLSNRKIETSRKPNPVHFPHLYFFEPLYQLLLKEDLIVVETSSVLDPSLLPAEIAKLIQLLETSETAASTVSSVSTERTDGDSISAEADSYDISKSTITASGNNTHFPLNQLKTRETHASYLEKAGSIKAHIKAGDIYEITFCQEFYLDNLQVDPVRLYMELNTISPAPFSAFFRYGNRYMLSSSMERFIRREGKLLRSQPIKGTIARGNTPAADQKQREALLNNEKEKAENIMIVDLVRNDLSRLALPGTVKVEELNALYSFAQVHQLISTIRAEIKPDTRLKDILKAMFPMGSMTGAPKIRAMELIDQHEAGSRGLFSGSVGYLDATGDFDFNVLIRTIIYESADRYLSFHTGSAITAPSGAEEEYQECLLKAAGIMRALSAAGLV